MLAGRCHCGRNAFEIEGELPDALTRCTCSLCSKRGHLYAYYPPEAFKVKARRQRRHLSLEQQARRQPLLHRLRLRPLRRQSRIQAGRGRDGKTRRIAVNARLLDDFEAADWPVTVIDGIRQR